MHGAPYPDWFLKRFWAKVDKTDTCWLWTASTAHGYGQMGVPNSVSGLGRATVERAHRIAYFHIVGPVPASLHLDHLCRVRHCVNPAHLEPVTPGENVRRGAPATKTHCANGHELTDENTYRSPKTGRRQCRTCRSVAAQAGRERKPLDAAYWREYRARRKAEGRPIRRTT